MSQMTERGRTRQGGEDGPGKDKLAQQEGMDILDEGSRTGRKGARQEGKGGA